MNYQEERDRRIRRAVFDLNALTQREVAVMDKLANTQRKIRDQLQVVHELLDRGDQEKETER